jgi:TP901 family phage tail tape measure protein
MAMNNFGAGFVLRAYDQTSSVLKQISAGMTGMFKTGKQGVDLLNQAIARRDIGTAMKRIGGGITGSLASMGAAAEGVATVVRNVRAMRGETDAMAVSMNNAIRSAEVSELGFTGEQAAKALEGIAMGGNSVSDSIKHMDTALRLARIGMMDASQAGGMLDTLVDVFGGTLDDSALRVDKMAWAMRQFGLSGQQVSTMLQMSASSAQLVGASFEDMLMATSMVGTVFPQTEKAAAAVNMAFQQLAAEDVQKKLKKFNVEVVDEQKNFKGLSSVLIDLMKQMEGMDESAKSTALRDIFGARSAGGMMTIIRQLETGVKDASGQMLYGGAAAEYLSKQMENSAGTADKMAKEMVSATDRMKAAFSLVQGAIGDTMTKLMDPIKMKIADAINKVADAFKALPEPVKKFIIGGMAVSGLLISIVGSLIIATTVFDQLGLSVGQLAIKVLKSAAIIAPFAIVVAGLGVAFYAAYKAMSRAGGPMEGILDKFKLGWKSVLELVQTGSLSEATKKSLGDPKNSGVAKFVAWFENVLARMDAFWSGFKQGWDQGIAALGPSIDAFVAKLGTITDMFVDNDPSGQLDKMGKMGKGAGSSLARLGEIGIQVMSAMLDLLPPIIRYFQGITGEDIANGIQALVGGFRAIYGVVVVVARAVGGFFNLIQFVGARIGELVGMWIDSFMTLGSVLDSVFSGDFSGAFIKAKNWGVRSFEALTGTSEEQSGQVKDMVSSLSGGEFGGSEGDKKFYGVQDKANAINEKVSEYRAVAASGGGEEEIRKRLLTQKGDKDALRHDAALMKELAELRKAIKELAGKDLIAQIETVTVAKAAKAGEAHEAGRSLAPMPVGF